MKKLLRVLILLICFCVVNDVCGQADVANPGTGHTRVGGYYLGWNNLGTAGTLEIRNDFTPTPYNIEFFINTKMVEMQPSGDLNLVVGSGGYEIAGQYVLHHNNITSNIFVGADAGFSNVSGNNNTFTGYSSGYANTTGTDNTFNGTAAGYSTDYSNYNTFMGSYAGFSNYADYNTFIGYVNFRSFIQAIPFHDTNLCNKKNSPNRFL